jgi:hypothetical protein
MLIGTALSSNASFQVRNDTFETNSNYPFLKVKQSATVRRETTWKKHKAMHFLQTKLLTWNENVPTCPALVARGPVMDPEGIPSRESRPCERLAIGQIREGGIATL